MASADYVVVGGGINGLVAAAMLGKKGRKVPGLGGGSGLLLANALT